MEDHDMEIADCAAQAANLTTFASDVGYTNGLLATFLNSGPQRGVLGAALENCMVSKGWQVVRLSDERGAKLWQMPREQMRTLLANMVGGSSPEGTVVRSWNNEAANAANKRFGIRPDFVQLGSLSVAALHNATASTIPSPKDSKKINYAQSIKITNLTKLSPKPTLLIVGYEKLSRHNGTGVKFRRQGPTPSTTASSVDGGIDVASSSTGTLFSKKEGNFRIFSISHGVWSFDAILGPPVLSFCFGSPAFEVNEGDVVYAGMFDLSSASLAPDFDQSRLQVFLGDVALPSPVKRAQYDRRVKFPCEGNSAYAIEFTSSDSTAPKNALPQH